jgi:hypothetical protein
MIKKIISLPGKPGLFRLVSQTKTMLIVESILDHKRVPIYQTTNAVSLGDISIYTDSDNIPLSKILQQIIEKQDKTPLQIDPSPEALTAWFAEILPEFDRQRVHIADIKKIANWYNLLLKDGFTRFEEEAPEEKTSEEPEASKQQDPPAAAE